MEDLDRAADHLSGVAQVVTSPENPMGYPGIDPIITTYLVAKRAGLIPMPHITPRDKNKLHIYSQVLTASKLGIRNFFVIGGDPINPAVGSKEVRELDVMQTLRAVKEAGNYMKDGEPEIAVGSSLNPYRPNESEIVSKKSENGADFFITQMIYNASLLQTDWMRAIGYKISAGFMPIVRKSQLSSIKKMGVSFDPSILQRLENSTDISNESSRLILEAFDQLKDTVNGIHIMPLGNNRLAKEILESI